MLSIIICSRKSDIPEILKKNISETINIEYEFIIIDNSKNEYSIFSAYNEGVRRAKYPYLCFMHDDIFFHTQDWGNKVVNHFLGNGSIGLLGVVGTHFLPRIPVYWSDTGVLSGRLIQGWIENGMYKSEEVNHNKYSESTNSIEAVAVDGLWFCMPKKNFNFISFDEAKFKGFHCYDLDICLQTLHINYKIEIILDIIIEHYSSGSDSSDLEMSLRIFYNKWKSYLPIENGVHIEKSEKKDIVNNILKIRKKKRLLFVRSTSLYLILKTIKSLFLKNR